MSVLRHRLQAPDAGAGAGGGTGGGGGSGTGAAAAGSGAAAASAAGTGDGGGKGADGKGGAAPAQGAGGGGDGKGGTGAGTGADAAAAAAAAAAAGGTGTGDKGKDGAATAGAGAAWDANWRETYAGDDPAKLNVLKRYESPRALMDALFAARQKIESGELKAPLPDKPTPEQLASYRKENGIPEKAEGYFENLPDGVKIDDGDKVMLGEYAKAMHELNLTPAQASKLFAVRQQQLDTMVTNQVAQDETLKTQVEDQLRGEWGNEYRPNLNAIHNLLSGFPEDAREALMSARGPDGKAIFNNKSLLQAFAQIARTVSPFGSIVGADGGSLDGKGVEARMAEITKMMGAPKGSAEYRAYYDNPKVQEEYRNLINAQERLKARTAA